MDSSRLPGKVILPFAGSTIIECIYQRMERSKKTNHLIVGTSVEASDDPLVEILKINNINYFRGSLDNVLDRFVNICYQHNPEFVVRITGDCPLIDPIIVDNCIERCVLENYDYFHLLEPYPDGLDVEIFKVAALNQAYIHANKDSEKEHLGQYFLNNPLKFSIGGLKLFNNEHQEIRLTLDEWSDYSFLLELEKNIENIHKKDSEEILSYIFQHKDLLKINSKNIRNEGLEQSILND